MIHASTTILEFLGKTRLTPYEALGYYFLKLLLVSFALYLVIQAIGAIPMLGRFFRASWGKLVLYILTLATAGLLAFQLVPLRILRALELTGGPKEFVWPDIVFTALMLASLSRLWELGHRWIEGKVSNAGGPEF